MSNRSFTATTNTSNNTTHNVLIHSSDNQPRNPHQQPSAKQLQIQQPQLIAQHQYYHQQPQQQPQPQSLQQDYMLHRRHHQPSSSSNYHQTMHAKSFDESQLIYHQQQQQPQPQWCPPQYPPQLPQFQRYPPPTAAPKQPHHHAHHSHHHNHSHPPSYPPPAALQPHPQPSTNQDQQRHQSATAHSKHRRHSSTSRIKSSSSAAAGSADLIKNSNFIQSITNNFMSFGAPFLFDWRLFCERGQPRYVHKHEGDGLRVDECEARFLNKIAQEEKASMINAISDDDDQTSASIKHHHHHHQQQPQQAQRAKSNKLTAANVECLGSVRKSGFLSVKKWLIRKKNSLELARKRGWKGYWVCLKGTTLLFYRCDCDNSSNNNQNNQNKSNEITRNNQNNGGHIIEARPRHLIFVDACLVQAIPEHPKRDFVFCLSTAFGDAYLLDAPCLVERDYWIAAIHCSCAAQLARSSGRCTVSHILFKEIKHLEEQIEQDQRVRNDCEQIISTTLSTVSITANEAKLKQQQLMNQIVNLDEKIEKNRIEIFRFRAYLSAITNEEDPNPKTLLSQTTKRSKIQLNRLGVFSVSSLHAFNCAKNPTIIGNLTRSSSEDNLGNVNRQDTADHQPPSAFESLKSSNKSSTKSPSSNSTIVMVKMLNGDIQKFTNFNVTESADQILMKLLPQSIARDYYLRNMNDHSNVFKRHETLMNHMNQTLEIVPKIMFTCEMTRDSNDQLFGFSVESELFQDDLRVYVSRVEPQSLASQQSLRRGDEIVVINGAFVQDLDMMYVESILQEELTLCLTIRAARDETSTSRAGSRPNSSLCTFSNLINQQQQQPTSFSALDLTKLSQQQQQQQANTDDLIESLVCPPPPPIDISQMILSEKQLSKYIVPKVDNYLLSTIIDSGDHRIDDNWKHCHYRKSFPDQQKQHQHHHHHHHNRRSSSNRHSYSSSLKLSKCSSAKCTSTNIDNDGTHQQQQPQQPVRPHSAVPLGESVANYPRQSSSSGHHHHHHHHHGSHHKHHHHHHHGGHHHSKSSAVNQSSSADTGHQHHHHHHHHHHSSTKHIYHINEANQTAVPPANTATAAAAAAAAANLYGLLEQQLTLSSGNFDAQQPPQPQPQPPLPPQQQQSSSSTFIPNTLQPQPQAQQPIISQSSSSSLTIQPELIAQLNEMDLAATPLQPQPQPPPQATCGTIIDESMVLENLQQQPQPPQQQPLQHDHQQQVQIPQSSITDITDDQQQSKPSSSSLKNKYGGEITNEKLRKVVHELMDTEVTYCQALDQLMKLYLDPLIKSSQLTSIDTKILIGQIPEVIQIQNKFRNELQQIITADDLNIEGIAKCFLNYSNDFKNYSTFCASHSKAIKLLADDKSIIHDWLVKQSKQLISKHPNMYSLESYLIRPIQRILKYPLLLSQLKTLCLKDSPPYFKINEALRAIENVAEHINEMQRINEEYGQIFENLLMSTTGKESKSKKFTCQFDLTPTSLLHYGGVEWINSLEFLGKNYRKSNQSSGSGSGCGSGGSSGGSLNLHSMCFVFKQCVVFLCKETIKHGKASKKQQATATDMEIIRHQVLIPVSEVQVRSCQQSQQSQQDSNLSHEEEELDFKWELIQLKTNAQGKRLEKIFRLANSTNEYRNLFLRTIRQIIRDDVRRMNVIMNSSSMTATTSTLPSNSMMKRQTLATSPTLKRSLRTIFSSNSSNNHTGTDGTQQQSQKKSMVSFASTQNLTRCGYCGEDFTKMFKKV